MCSNFESLLLIKVVYLIQTEENLAEIVHVSIIDIKRGHLLPWQFSHELHYCGTLQIYKFEIHFLPKQILRRKMVVNFKFNSCIWSSWMIYLMKTFNIFLWWYDIIRDELSRNSIGVSTNNSPVHVQRPQEPACSRLISWLMATNFDDGCKMKTISIYLLSSTNPIVIKIWVGCWKPHGRHPARDILPVVVNNILVLVDSQTYSTSAS